MGRLTTNTNNISSEETKNVTTNTEIKVTQPGNVYTFIDENGNVTQIQKSVKERLKFYPEQVNAPVIEPCVIGVSGDLGRTNCTDGIALGCGDVGSNTEMAYAIY